MFLPFVGLETGALFMPKDKSFFFFSYVLRGLLTAHWHFLHMPERVTCLWARAAERLEFLNLTQGTLMGTPLGGSALGPYLDRHQLPWGLNTFCHGSWEDQAGMASPLT